MQSDTTVGVAIGTEAALLKEAAADGSVRVHQSRVLSQGESEVCVASSAPWAFGLDWTAAVQMRGTMGVVETAGSGSMAETRRFSLDYAAVYREDQRLLGQPFHCVFGPPNHAFAVFTARSFPIASLPSSLFQDTRQSEAGAADVGRPSSGQLQLGRALGPEQGQ